MCATWAAAARYRTRAFCSADRDLSDCHVPLVAPSSATGPWPETCSDVVGAIADDGFGSMRDGNILHRRPGVNAGPSISARGIAELRGGNVAEMVQLELGLRAATTAPFNSANAPDTGRGPIKYLPRRV